MGHTCSVENFIIMEALLDYKRKCKDKLDNFKSQASQQTKVPTMEEVNALAELELISRTAEKLFSESRTKTLEDAILGKEEDVKSNKTYVPLQDIVRKAYEEDGKIIECRAKSAVENDWRIVKNPSWLWEIFDYRVHTEIQTSLDEGSLSEQEKALIDGCAWFRLNDADESCIVFQPKDYVLKRFGYKIFDSETNKWKDWD